MYQKVFFLLITLWSLSHSNKDAETSISTFSVVYEGSDNTDVFCPDPGGIMFGHRKPEYNALPLPMGSQIHFVCRPAYRLDGYNKMVCDKTGQWEPPTKPQCHPVVCPEPRVEHGKIRSSKLGVYYTGTTVQVICDDGYRLQDKAIELMECHLSGSWVGHSGQYMIELPNCIENTCSSPPQLPNSQTQVEGDFGWDGGYRINSIVTYHCNSGFQIEDLQGSHLVCQNGKWQPQHPNVPLSKCVQGGCSKPLPVQNGYYVPHLTEIYPYGVFVKYFCYMDYMPTRPFVFQCMDDGRWSPPMQSENLPTCQRDQDASCSEPLYVQHGRILKINGSGPSVNMRYPENTVITYVCEGGFRMLECNSNWIMCKGGSWINRLPVCVESNGCGRPPIVLYATVIRQDLGIPAVVDIDYPLYTKIKYKCLPGFQLLGSPDLICSLDGCWTPNPPQCIFVSPSSYDSPDWTVHPDVKSSESGNVDYNWSDSHLITVSVATAGSIIGALLLIQVLVLVQRRKCCLRRQRIRGHNHRSIRRPVPPSPDATSPTHLPPNHDPDRVALIAFADGVQVVLPSYEEAIRQQGPPPFEAFGGVHRSRWSRGTLPSLPPTRRFRLSSAARESSTETSNGGPTRQSSSTSHSASVADSIGSADTGANSEVSTTITLDTLSSNASNISQTALSSRAINGSLASFDTCSIVNQEGVPLLEENEFEEPSTTNDRIDCNAPALDCDITSGASG